MTTRICTECGRTFEPSSGHLRCPACRSHNLCACGARKQKDSTGKGRGQYVFGHIVVMEQLLGRYLLPDENVHHLNGVKDDKRRNNTIVRVTSLATQ
jgi:hypothetical protein